MDEDFIAKRLERIRKAVQAQKEKQKAQRRKAAKLRKSNARRKGTVAAEVRDITVDIMS